MSPRHALTDPTEFKPIGYPNTDDWYVVVFSHGDGFTKNSSIKRQGRQFWRWYPNRKEVNIT